MGYLHLFLLTYLFTSCSTAADRDRESRHGTEGVLDWRTWHSAADVRWLMTTVKIRRSSFASCALAGLAITLHYTLYFLLQLASTRTNGAVPLHVIKYVHVYDTLDAARSAASDRRRCASRDTLGTSPDDGIVTEWKPQVRLSAVSISVGTE